MISSCSHELSSFGWDIALYVQELGFEPRHSTYPHLRWNFKPLGYLQKKMISSLLNKTIRKNSSSIPDKNNFLLN
jgi:hypothetical protein